MRLAQDLGTGARLLGYLAARGDEPARATADPEELALDADRLRQRSGQYGISFSA